MVEKPFRAQRTLQSPMCELKQMEPLTLHGRPNREEAKTSHSGDLRWKLNKNEKDAVSVFRH